MGRLISRKIKRADCEKINITRIHSHIALATIVTKWSLARNFTSTILSLHAPHFDESTTNSLTIAATIYWEHLAGNIKGS